MTPRGPKSWLMAAAVLLFALPSMANDTDCTDRWPIATFDADNLRSRPYACTFVGGYLVPGKTMVPHFVTPIGKHGLREP